MKTSRKHFRYHHAALAALLVGIVLLLNAMAACPALHEKIHHDAGKPDHECVVTIFAHGKVESATIDVPVAVATAPVEATPQIVFSVFSTAIEKLPPGRGPPVIISSQA